jgi:photosystem II stability/assembly factor-like uncharacterized protein
MKLLFTILFVTLSGFAFAQEGWSWVNPLPQGNNLSDIEVTANLSVAVGYGGTIMTNNGSGWEIRDGGFEDVLFSVCIYGNNIWASGVDGAILHCSDGSGTSWESQTSGVDKQLRSVFFMDDQKGWAVGLERTILHTSDGGQNWGVQSSGGNTHLYSVFIINESVGYACGYDLSSSKGIILKTTNGGTYWPGQINPALNNQLRSIYFKDIDNGVAVGENGTVLYTTNAGLNWYLADSKTTSDLMDADYDNQGNGYAVGDDGVIIYTSDFGQNWNLQNSGTENILYGVSSNRIVGETGIILSSTNGGQAWEFESTGFTDNLLSLDFVTDNIGYATGVDGKIYRTTDGGLTWPLLPTSITVGLGKVQFINLDTGWVASSHYIYRTTDGGVSWVEQLYLPQPNEVIFDVEFVKGLPGEPVFGFACGGLAGFWKSTDGGETWNGGVACTNGNFLGCSFVDKNNGWLVGVPSTVNTITIMRTTDGGGTFEEQTNPIIEPYMRDVSFVTNQRGLAVGNNGQTLYTSDGGANWVERTNGSYNWQEVFLSETGKAWAVGFKSGVGGIAHSTDWGYTWQMQASGVYPQLNGIDFINDNEGWIVGNNGTILHTTNGGVTFVEEEQINEIPTSYFLSNNFPNPFNPSTKIRYSIPQSAKVQIKIFDMLGNEIETLINEEKSVGTYELNWNAIDLPSGVYFYQLKTGKFIETKKMILIK